MDAFALFGIFIQRPWLALLLSCLFASAYFWRRHRVTLIGSLVWMLYAIYEDGIKRGALCSGDCAIRVDLIFLYPLLLGITVAAALALRRPVQGGVLEEPGQDDPHA